MNIRVDKVSQEAGERKIELELRLFSPGESEVIPESWEPEITVATITRTPNGDAKIELTIGSVSCLPSAADLDAVAEEERISKETEIAAT